MKPPTTLRDLPVKEESVQRQIIDLFTALGFAVYQASRRGVKTKNGRVFGADGCSKELPDLYIRWPDWPPGMQLAIEVKKPKGWRWTTDEQEAAWRCGATAKVHSVDQAVMTVYAFWCGLFIGAPPHSLIQLFKSLPAGTFHGFYSEGL